MILSNRGESRYAIAIPLPLQ